MCAESELLCQQSRSIINRTFERSSKRGKPLSEWPW